MKDKGENLIKAFDYIRTFYNQVAQMISDAGELMAKEKWDTPESSSITDNLSKSLDYPDYWMTFYVYKNFFNNDIKNQIKGVLVFFDVNINEFPLSIVCGNVNESPESYNKFDLYHLWYDNKDKLKNLTGEVIKLEATHLGRSISGKVFAVPLTSIKSKEDFKKIVDKLVALN